MLVLAPLLFLALASTNAEPAALDAAGPAAVSEPAAPATKKTPAALSALLVRRSDKAADAEADGATQPAKAPAPEEDVPSGAPSDDYGFVAWCHGALFGHMELYDMVKPELDKLERSKAEAADNAKLDKEQQAAGREYLKLYGRALLAAEHASPTAIHARGVQADADGYRMWTAARAAQPTTRMWAWLTWELPARCETAANRLEERSTLFAEALRPQTSDSAASERPAAEAPPAEAKPAEAAPAETPAATEKPAP